TKWRDSLIFFTLSINDEIGLFKLKLSTLKISLILLIPVSFLVFFKLYLLHSYIAIACMLNIYKSSKIPNNPFIRHFKLNSSHNGSNLGRMMLNYSLET